MKAYNPAYPRLREGAVSVVNGKLITTFRRDGQDFQLIGLPTPQPPLEMRGGVWYSTPEDLEAVGPYHNP